MPIPVELPDKKNAISYTLPWIIQGVVQMMKHFCDEAKAIELVENEDDSDLDKMKDTMYSEMSTIRSEVKEKFKRKVKAVVAVTGMLSMIKSERESIIRIKSMARDCMLP